MFDPGNHILERTHIPKRDPTAAPTFFRTTGHNLRIPMTDSTLVATNNTNDYKSTIYHIIIFDYVLSKIYARNAFRPHRFRNAEIPSLFVIGNSPAEADLPIRPLRIRVFSRPGHRIWKRICKRTA